MGVLQICRSEQKRRVKEIERLVAELVSLPAPVLGQAPVPEDLRQLLIEAAGLQGGVRQRQIKYLTKLLQAHPIEALYTLVGNHRGKHLAVRKQLHTLEFYRDALIDEALARQESCRQQRLAWEENWSSETVRELHQRMPEIDPQLLSRLAYLFARTRNPRYSREIFRYLRSMDELRQRTAERLESQ